MDKTSLMIGTLLFVVFMFPIIYVLLKQKSNETKHKKALNKIASDQGLKLDKFETYGHLSLGLDSSAKKLIVIDPKIAEQPEVIDLKNVSRVNISKTLQPGSRNKERIIHLGLEISDKNSKKTTEITFYDEDDYESIDAEIRLNEARQWDEILQKNLAF